MELILKLDMNAVDLLELALVSAKSKTEDDIETLSNGFYPLPGALAEAERTLHFIEEFIFQLQCFRNP